MRNANIYLDVVGTTGPHLRHAIDKLGAERILFGTDWSATWRWLSVPGTLHQIRMTALDNAALTAAEREQIAWKTAATLFKLEPELQRAGVARETAGQRLAG
jgi:predicted TIM-barrel fold metal-dependent hydrolase